MGTPAQEAIALLIDLAQQGEIDPWDVDVIKVIDRFLNELGLMERSESPNQEADLPQSGQAFLWASMLVLLKADTLEFFEKAEEVEEAEGADIDDLEETELARRSLPEQLERQLKRRASAPPLRKRRVTLQELIEQIQLLASQLEETPSLTQTKSSVRSRREVARAIATLAHDENLTEVAAQLEEFLSLHLPQLAPEQDCIELDRLLYWWEKHKILGSERENLAEHSQTEDRVGVFWALLLLSAQSKVELSQQEFYQELNIRPIRSNTADSGFEISAK